MVVCWFFIADCCVLVGIVTLRYLLACLSLFYVCIGLGLLLLVWVAVLGAASAVCGCDWLL